MCYLYIYFVYTDSSLVVWMQKPVKTNVTGERRDSVHHGNGDAGIRKGDHRKWPPTWKWVSYDATWGVPRAHTYIKGGFRQFFTIRFAATYAPLILED